MYRYVLIAAIAAAAPAAAQNEPGEACPDGRISFVFIDNNTIFDTADPDLDDRFRWAYGIANKLHVRTRQWVIRQELLFRPGDCYDTFVLAETERVLRAYPFLGQVNIYGVRQTDGSHHVIVDTHDDWSTRVDIRFDLDGGLQLNGARLTELNFLGMGQAVGVFWQEEEVLREYGLSYWAPQLGRSRWDFAMDVGRTRAGSFVRQQIGYPFVGELGHWAGRQAFLRQHQFFDYILLDDRQEASPHVLLPTLDERFELSVLRRFGDRGRALMAGLGVSSRDLEYPGEIDIAPDGVFDERVPADSITAGPVVGQSASRDAFRMHLLLGARDIRWLERRGLDGILGAEDVRVGFELGLDIGRSLPSFGDDDLALTGLLYAATEIGSSLFALQGRVDALRKFTERRGGSPWEDVYGGAELFAYLRRSPTAAGSLLFRIYAAGGWRTRTPFQLTLGGERALRGYDDERYPGGRRVVLTVEQRQFLGWPFAGLFDTGLTIFSDVGRMWPGDAPYGVDSGWRVSAGTGLRFAFPAGSRGTYRIDIAWPVERRTTLGDFRLLVTVGEVVGLGGAGQDFQLIRSRPDGVAGALFRLNPRPGT